MSLNRPFALKIRQKAWQDIKCPASWIISPVLHLKWNILDKFFFKSRHAFEYQLFNLIPTGVSKWPTPLHICIQNRNYIYWTVQTPRISLISNFLDLAWLQHLLWRHNFWCDWQAIIKWLKFEICITFYMQMIMRWFFIVNFLQQGWFVLKFRFLQLMTSTVFIRTLLGSKCKFKW